MAAVIANTDYHAKEADRRQTCEAVTKVDNAQVTITQADSEEIGGLSRDGRSNRKHRLSR